MTLYYWSNRPRKDFNYVSREELRTFFASVSPYIKLKTFCKECDIAQSNISQFIRYGSSSISTDKLLDLYKAVTDYFEKIA